MPLKRKSIARRLGRYVLLLSAGILVSVSILLGFVSHQLIERVSMEVAGKEVDLVISDIEKMISEVERAVDNVDWFVQRNSHRQRFMYEATRELVLSNPSIIGSAVAFEPYYFKGTRWFAPYTYVEKETEEIRTIQMGNSDYDYPTLDWYRVPRLYDRPVWSEPYFDEGGGDRQMATYSLPLKDTTGTFFGILTSDISLSWLSTRLQSIAPYWDSHMMLISARGTFIVHPDPSLVLNATIFDEAAESGDERAMEVAQNMVNGKRGSSRFRGTNNEDYYGIYGPLSNGWSVLLVTSYVSVFRNLYAYNLVLGVLMLLGLLALYFGCRNVVRRQTMPIVEFSQAAMTMAKGNFKARLPEVRTQDELQTLNKSMAYMQQSINEYITELKSTTASNERYESELNIARNIQMSMLPQNFPVREDCDLFGMVQPAREVGGDLYDFIEVGDRLYFLIGDVSGKGVPAALFMAITRAAFRFIGALDLSMSEVVERVNNSLCDGNTNDMFVTLFAGCLNLTTGELDYCNAGHNPIIVVRPDGSASFLRAKPNLAAGLVVEFPYEEEHLRLARGSRLLLYTDGVTEAERPDKKQFGEQALLSWAKHLSPGVSSNAAAMELYSRVRHYAAGAEQNDDITILSVLYKEK